MAITDTFNIDKRHNESLGNDFFQEIAKDENFVGSLYDLDYE